MRSQISDTQDKDNIVFVTEAKNEPNLFQTEAEDEDNDEGPDLDDEQEPTDEETIQRQVKRI